MAENLEEFTPFLEKYLLADDREAYINSLKADSKEKLLFNILLSYE